MDDKKKASKKIYLVMACVFGLICVGSIIWLAEYLIGIRKAEADMGELVSSYVFEEPSQPAPEPPAQTEPDIPTEPEEEPEEEPKLAELDLEACGLADRKIDFAGLQANENADIYAWILVPGTMIDYPVLQHPEEMDYYLDHNLDGSTGYPGCIYTQRMNAKDWSNFNTILYGHNMKNGSYFAGLHKYKDPDFFRENRFIYIYTEDGRILAYEIFASYVSGNEHLLMAYDTNTESGRSSYLDGIFEHTGYGCNFEEGLALTDKNRIITLSTCISGQETKRYLVQGVLVAEGTQP